ncbi:MAG TPA: hypothetical protein V6D22_22485 [Candidatus Obscuribacterales bacterium]
MTRREPNDIIGKIPGFDSNGNLPPGIHDATIEQIKARFARNAHRNRLFSGLVEVLEILRDCNCLEVYLNGSFITEKEMPGDYDLCYEPLGIQATAEFRRFLENKETRKERYLGDIFVRMPEPPFCIDHVADWQTDTRQDDVGKGIIRIRLRSDDNAEE